MSGLYSDLPEVSGAGGNQQPPFKQAAWAGGAAASLAGPAVARPPGPALPKPRPRAPLPPPPPGPPQPAVPPLPPSSAAALLFSAGQDPEEEGGQAEGEYDPAAPNSYPAVIAVRASAAGAAAAAAAAADEASASAAAAAAVTALTGEPAGVERGLPLAARLMARMGWVEGEGLGPKDGRRKGVTAPLVARKTGALAATIGLGAEVRMGGWGGGAGLGAAAREGEDEGGWGEGAAPPGK